MTQGQREAVPFHCPRCGALMRKPAGSNLYWHVDNNHPRCNITNIVGAVLEVAQTGTSPSGPVGEPQTKDK